MKKLRIEDRALLDTYHSKHCAACGKAGCDPCHVISRGAGGDDVDDNLIPLCRKHHTLQHQVGWYYLVTKFPSVALALKVKGWRFDDRSLVRNV